MGSSSRRSEAEIEEISQLHCDFYVPERCDATSKPHVGPVLLHPPEARDSHLALIKQSETPDIQNSVLPTDSLKLQGYDMKESMMSLCDLCTYIDLEHHFAVGPGQVVSSYINNTKVVLGTFEQIKARSQCTFCSWLAEFLRTSDSYMAGPVMEPKECLIELSIERENDFHKGSWFTVGRIRFRDSACYDIAELRASPCDDLANGEGAVIKCGPVEHFETVSTLVRYWLQKCMHSHPACRYRDTNSWTDEFRVIDTHAMEVVSTSTRVPYVALSYVWGGVAQATVDSKGRLLEIPATIKDSITFTAAIGYRYLWVDAVCVSSASHDARMNDIKLMDKIYNGAVAVIIAASGKDANHGIRGVSRMASPYKSFRFPDALLHCRKPGNFSEGMLQPYIDRCWTLQEALLARRRIIFTEDEILFECHTAVGRESLGHQFEIAAIDSFRFGSLIKSHISSFSGSQDIYQSVVHRFMHRKLTYEYDIKNAFQGIANHIARLFDDQTCWTIPRKNLMWALLWCPRERSKSYGDWLGRPTESKGKTAIIRRRQNAPGECPFPSWFWGAWVMENVTWSETFGQVNDDDFAEALVQQWTETEWRSIEKTGILCFEAEIVNMVPHPTIPAVDSEYYLEGGMEQKHWHAKTCTFITATVWKKRDYESGISALAVVLKDGIAHRVGHLVLTSSEWGDARPVRKLIKLG